MADADDITTVPPTIAQLPFFASGRFPKPDLLGRCEGDRVALLSANEFVDRIRDLGLGLAALGMARGDRVALLSESRPEWLVADFAILTAGAITVPVYPTLSSEQVGFIVRDSEATLAIVSNAAQLAKLVAVAGDTIALKTVVMMDTAGAPATAPFTILSWDEVASRGHRRILDGWGVGRAFHDEAKRVRPDDLATIIYTSGTTGQPKGVMLTHANLVANLTGITGVLSLGQDDVALSFLPLCHAFERIVAYVYFVTGVSMMFAESLDTVARDLKRVRPTVMTGVPRVFEKLEARITTMATASGGLKARIFRWAASVAEARGRRLPEGATPSVWLRVQSSLADRLVFRKIRDGMGGRLRYAVSGSAPLGARLGQFFYGLGFPILEGYGLTETAPVLCVMPLERVRFGTVGPPLPNVELRIAADGEVLARGPNVMQAYYKRPAETAQAFDDGWFRTGDIGRLDEAGYLEITDRKKELLVTSGGKKIAPQPIENALRANPLVSEAVLLGDHRHFPAALIVPDFAELAARMKVARPADETAARTLVDRPDVRVLFAAVVDSINATLAQFERIKKFSLLTRDFTMAAGELTPTLKVKRNVVHDKFAGVIDAVYDRAR
jgi:long-chain acyl-CoA synthetase